MNNFKYTLTDFLTPGIIISFLLIVAGIVFVIFTNEISFLLIGVSVALLGAFQLFAGINNLINDLKRTKPKRKPQFSEKTFTKSYEPKDIPKDDESDEDEFRIIKKASSMDDKKINNKNEESDEELSDMRIIGSLSNKESYQKTNIPHQINEKDKSVMLLDSEVTDEKNQNSVTEDEGILKKENAGKKTDGDTEIQTESDVKDVINDDSINKVKENLKDDENITLQENQNEYETSDDKKHHSIPLKFINKFRKIEINGEAMKELLKNENNFDFKPKEELEFLLSKLLVILSSITDTKTAVFVLVDNDSEKFIIESFVTTIPDKISKENQFSFADDLISNIIINKKPEILKEINEDAETDLIPYYTDKTGTNSFVGLPIIYNDLVLGVLAVDSGINDAYDEAVINLLSDFKNLCSAFVYNYNEKYNLYQEQKTLYAIEKFTDIIQDNEDKQENIIDAIISSVQNTFNFERIGICGYNEADDCWNVVGLNSKEYEDYGAVISLDNSYISRTLTNYEPFYKKISDSNEIRVNDKEPKYDDGVFISVPLKSKTTNFGALFAESRKITYLNESDMNTLLRLSEFAALSIERLNILDVLQTSVMIDHNSGLYNHSAFYHRLKEEFIRAKDFKYPVSLILIRIDKYESYNQYPQKIDQITLHVLNQIEKNLRIYDIFGKADNDIFGVILIESDSYKSKLWAEKLRSEIAKTIIEIDNHKFSVTVSLGVTELSKDSDANTILNNAMDSLNKSLEKTNTVTVY